MFWNCIEKKETENIGVSIECFTWYFTWSSNSSILTFIQSSDAKCFNMNTYNENIWNIPVILILIKKIKYSSFLIILTHLYVKKLAHFIYEAFQTRKHWLLVSLVIIFVNNRVFYFIYFFCCIFLLLYCMQYHICKWECNKCYVCKCYIMNNSVVNS